MHWIHIYFRSRAIGLNLTTLLLFILFLNKKLIIFNILAGNNDDTNKRGKYVLERLRHMH